MTDTVRQDDFAAYIDEVLDINRYVTFEPTFDAFHNHLEITASSAFNSQTSPSGEKWPDWQWQSLRNRSEYPNHDTLWAAGRLRGSFIRGGSENVDQIESRESYFGSTVPYADEHNEGGVVEASDHLVKRKGRGMIRAGDPITLPQRTMLEITPDDADLFAEAVADSIVEQMKG